LPFPFIAMSLGLILLVLGGAASHAAWNVIVKAAPDQRAEVILVAIAAALVAGLALPFLPLPSGAWPYLIASVLIQFLYFQLLGMVYRHGELSYAYPLMRGTAPLLTALIGTLLVGEHLAPGAWLGVILLCSGVFLLGADHWRSGRFGWRVTVYGQLNALAIASYTIVDGIGIRLSGAPASYIAWLFFLNGFPLVAQAAVSAPRRILLYARERWRTSLLCGVLMTASYGVALWAMTLAPMALVAALRETSVLFATLFAAAFLKERFGPARYAAVVLVTAGAIAMRMW
jgi:drug/metabolite transporter (DMT)-like permease